MNLIIQKSKTVLAVLLLVLAKIAANAQSLPNVQKVSLRAPTDINIDGKATEWQDKFQAYNHANFISYTMSNDDDNIYLVISTAGAYAIDKIGQGGITFTISHSISKKNREKAVDNISVRFPTIVIGKSSGFGYRAKQYSSLKKDTAANKKMIDSLIFTSNQDLIAKYKTIRIIGVKGIEDSTISIYNTEGIKAAARFDKRMSYVYEVAIPLKYLNINDASVISYNIKLNGPPSPEEWLKIGKYPPPIISLDNGDVDHNYEYINNPTDLWGEYTLAKK